jgi:3-oxoadipate enol-lactonase
VAAVNWLPQLPEIRCPTLVLAGARDLGAPPAMAQAIAEGIPGAQLQVFDNASHLSVYEEPAAFRAALEAFIPA